MKKLLSGTIALLAVLMFPAMASAHVIVTPDQADIGASTMFNVSVPNEKQVAVISVKLDIPKGVQNVQPDVLAGWKITTTKNNDNVTSITWTGNIPAGQRADFAFKAQVPADAGRLDWKAYQTYADGSIVRWDQNPATNGKAVKNDVGPYSVTKVVNDLSAASTSKTSGSNASSLALVFSIAALIFSLASLFLRRRK